MSKQASAEIEEITDIESQAEKAVFCRNCRHAVTKPALAIEPHEHTFRNPAGYSFHVVCYSDAPGAADVGDSTTEYSWFPDYAWTFAVCTECQNHLGWWFNGPDRFAGLIATRIIR